MIPITVRLVALCLLPLLGSPVYVCPGTGPQDGAVRNAAGQVEAVTRLIQAG